ncbi:Magnesium transporter protein 1 [Orchesella cincta]|uniref:Magnesium transporter protein 1 n=1 Tax=Orchesella cincta TaxID=48709 RepID=A0A1D2MS90_ORCCI|nr:Magnesium transporter protein 1 [Orchesella cincta]
MLRNKRMSLMCTFAFVLVACNVFLTDTKLISKIDKAHPNEALMSRKLNKIVGMMDGEGNAIQGVIPMSANEYRELVFDPPRNYTIFVLFYNDNHICDKCQMVLTAFNKVADTFLRLNTKFDKEANTWYMPIAAFFVTVKMSEGYRNVMVDLDPALPNLYYFAPSLSLKYNAFEQMDKLVPEYGIFHEEKIPWWIEQKSGIQIFLEGEPSVALSNLYYIFAISIMVLFNVYHLGYWETLVNAIKNANYSYSISVIVVYFLSGQMYNYMNNRPVFGNRGLSLMSLVYPGSRQYGIESVIIMMLYGTIIYGIIQLVEIRERQLAERLRNSVVQQKVFSGLSCVYFGFMVIQFLFNLKTGR